MGPSHGLLLKAEVSFLILRDGTVREIKVTNGSEISRSISPLRAPSKRSRQPSGASRRYEADVLPVSFYFRHVLNDPFSCCFDWTVYDRRAERFRSPRCPGHDAGPGRVRSASNIVRENGPRSSSCRQWAATPRETSLRDLDYSDRFEIIPIGSEGASTTVNYVLLRSLGADFGWSSPTWPGHGVSAP